MGDNGREDGLQQGAPGVDGQDFEDIVHPCSVRFNFATSLVVSCHVPDRSVSAWIFSTTLLTFAFEGFRLGPANTLLWCGDDRVALTPKPGVFVFEF